MILGRRKKKLRWPDGEGKPISEREREERVPIRQAFLGCGPKLTLGQMVSPGLFHISLLQKPLLVTGSFCSSVTSKPPVTSMLSLVINY
jgi:hypothetical protein